MTGKKRQKWATTITLLVLAAPSPGQRLSDFLQVSGWQLTMSVRGASSGSHSGPMGTDTWTASVSGTATAVLDQYNAPGQFWTGTLTGTAIFDYKMVSRQPGGCTTTTTIAGTGALQKLGGEDFMFMLGPGDFYQMFLGKSSLPLTTTILIECPNSPPGTISNTFVDRAWPNFGRGNNEEQPFPASGLTLSGQLKAEWFTPGGNSWILSSDVPPTQYADLTYELAPLGTTDLVLEVESAAYKTWRPKAQKDGKAGEAIELKARLRNRDDSPLKQRIKKFTWHLENTSREPGVAMNWPANGAEGTFDMKFEAGAGQFITDGEERQRMERFMTTEGDSDIAKVVPYDWGGWSVLRVTAELLDGKTIEGELKEPNGDNVIRLPKRKPGSLIADVWKEKPGREGSDNSDDENHPGGDPAFKGDGLTLYEEYRGFYINGDREDENEQADPEKQDLFVLNLAGGEVDQAAGFVKKHLGIKVHHKMLRAEMSDSRVVNRHYDSGAHKVDQHGLIVKVDGSISGFMQAVSSINRPANPKSISVVRIPVNLPARGVGGRTSYAALSIAHEILHAIAVYHHGDADDRVVKWTPDGSGRYYENNAVYDGDGNQTGYEGAPAGTVTLRKEDGTAYVRTTPQESLIGVKDGPHSGSDFCIMRYDVANAYVSDADATLRYVVSEKPGMAICSTEDGDGVNHTDWQPQSRYGKAAPNRGNCVRQVVISDFYDPPQR